MTDETRLDHLEKRIEQVVNEIRSLKEFVTEMDHKLKKAGAYSSRYRIG